MTQYSKVVMTRVSSSCLSSSVCKCFLPFKTIMQDRHIVYLIKRTRRLSYSFPSFFSLILLGNMKQLDIKYLFKLSIRDNCNNKTQNLKLAMTVCCKLVKAPFAHDFPARKIVELRFYLPLRTMILETTIF